MNIRELKLFRHLASSLHFGRTSQACNITPSGLSRTIQRIEEGVGKSLLVRDKRNVELTPEGKIFLKYAEEAIGRWEELQYRFSSENILRGQLSLYCSVTAILTILPSILKRFRESYPEIHIKVQTGDAAMALEKLQSREVDVAIAARPETLHSQLEFINIIETPLIFIAPKEYPEIVVKTGNDIDWGETPIIMAAKGLSRTRVENWFAQKGVVPNIYAQVAGNEAIIPMVSLGCGVGVIPELVLEKSPQLDQVRLLNVEPRLDPFSVGVSTLKRSRTNPVVQAFLESVEGEG